jgi:hypothetical protein
LQTLEHADLDLSLGLLGFWGGRGENSLGVGETGSNVLGGEDVRE